MESSIIDKAVKMDIPSSYLPTYNDYVRLLNWFKVVNNQRKDVLWYDVVTSRYILYREMDCNIPYFRFLNDFLQWTLDSATVAISILFNSPPDKLPLTSLFIYSLAQRPTSDK